MNECQQKDAGGTVLLRDNWTTFVKARLNCSLPGQFPFYYNELQSTFLLRKQRLIYAVFTTAPSVSTTHSVMPDCRQYWHQEFSLANENCTVASTANKHWGAIETGPE